MVDADDQLIALRSAEKLEFQDLTNLEVQKKVSQSSFIRINDLLNIFRLNAEQLELDYQLLTAGRKSQGIDSTNTIIGDRVFLEEGADDFLAKPFELQQFEDTIQKYLGQS